MRLRTKSSTINSLVFANLMLTLLLVNFNDVYAEEGIILYYKLI